MKVLYALKLSVRQISIAITNRNSSKVIGTVGEATVAGTNIEQRPYSGAASQSWKFREIHVNL
ncbi:RICIN domain-containing protein [Paenibacillus qinlingensis]|uniref:RICIN domain-containing protein n=1 Tax=Paenibacillus qinlingensis TaxID=1837343 RepID=UPI0015658E3D|nr:RICIN domain-containing protein [Paenibacillus qinlingensis]NQX60069.1 RICIN domain-containing protein [Paenibacillus qinlingensis]